MKNLTYLIALNIVLFTSCMSSGRNYPENKDESINSNKSDEKQIEYAKIVKVYTNKDTVFAEADFIQYLTGSAAIEAAKKDGQADVIVSGQNDTTYAVPGDVYVVNNNEKLRKLPLSKSVEFKLVSQESGEIYVTQNALTHFIKSYKEKIYLLVIENNQIIKIEEIFMP